jgi:hypothetical protein
MKKITHPILLICMSLLFFSCERDFDIKVKSSEPQLIVEGYINNLYPEYNYVLISRSQDYYAPNFQSIPVSGATVKVTEGIANGSQIVWNANSINLTELNNPLIPANLRNGLYADARLITNPANALIAIPERFYKLDITVGSETYTGITQVPAIVPADSVTSGNAYIDDENRERVRITIHYKDPDTIGNTQFYYWRHRDNRNNFGWAGLTKSFAPGRDDLVNGQYIRITHPAGFELNDTLTYMLASVDRNTHSFWASYQEARNNSGSAFVTPVVMKNYMSGRNVIGCYMGLGISQKTIVTKR